MSSTYTDLLRFVLPATGELDGSWGSVVNVGATSLIETAIAGTATVTHDDSANYSLTTASGAADEARSMFLDITGALGAARNVVCPTKSKLYFLRNATTGGFAVTLKTTAGTGVSVPSGKYMMLYCDGTNVVEAVNYTATITPTTLGLVIGTNVQAYNANLTAINQALTSTSSPSFTTVTAALTGVASGNLVSGGALGTPASGVATNLTGTATALNIGGNAATATTASAVAVGGITGLGTGVATALAVNVGTAGAPVVNGGALGTPASGTLTNATGLPAAGVVGTAAILGANTFTAAQTLPAVGAILTGTSSGSTTLTAGAAASGTAVLPAAGGTLATLAGTETLTNKRVTPRILSAASYTTDTGTSLNCDTLDEFIVTAQAGALKFNNPTGTAVEGQVLLIAVTGTAARALTYDTKFEASTVALPSTTVTTARLNLGFIWRADTSKWTLLGAA